MMDCNKSQKASKSPLDAKLIFDVTKPIFGDKFYYCHFVSDAYKYDNFKYKQLKIECVNKFVDIFKEYREIHNYDIEQDSFEQFITGGPWTQTSLRNGYRYTTKGKECYSINICKKEALKFLPDTHEFYNLRQTIFKYDEIYTIAYFIFKEYIKMDIPDDFDKSRANQPVDTNKSSKKYTDVKVTNNYTYTDTNIDTNIDTDTNIDINTPIDDKQFKINKYMFDDCISKKVDQMFSIVSKQNNDILMKLKTLSHNVDELSSQVDILSQREYIPDSTVTTDTNTNTIDKLNSVYSDVIDFHNFCQHISVEPSHINIMASHKYFDAFCKILTKLIKSNGDPIRRVDKKFYCFENDSWTELDDNKLVKLQTELNKHIYILTITTISEKIINDPENAGSYEQIVNKIPENDLLSSTKNIKNIRLHLCKYL